MGMYSWSDAGKRCEAQAWQFAAAFTKAKIEAFRMAPEQVVRDNAKLLSVVDVASRRE
jgi:hypothetical protein